MRKIQAIAFLLFVAAVLYIRHIAQERRLDEIQQQSAMERDYYIFLVPAAEQGKVRCYAVSAENRYLALRYLEGRIKRRPEHNPFVVAKNDIYFIEK